MFLNVTVLLFFEQISAALVSILNFQKHGEKFIRTLYCQRKDSNVIIDVICILTQWLEKFLHLKHLPTLRARILNVNMLFFRMPSYTFFCVFFRYGCSQPCICSFIPFSIFVKRTVCFSAVSTVSSSQSFCI